jgi:hypothetical protein
VTPKRFAYASAILALLFSGAYMFVYLYRWEWNRALMAGVIFIAAEIALGVAAVLERVKAIEKRLSEPDATQRRMLERIEESGPGPKARFSWLEEKSGDLNVFIPVLLGAGVIVSGIAWLVERVAGATAKPALERNLAARLAPISLPAGALAGSGDVVVSVPKRSYVTLAKQAAALGFAILAGFLGIDLLSDATQNRPDRIVPGTTSEIRVDVYTNDTKYSRTEAIETLWSTCRAMVPSELAAPIARASSSRFVLRVEPALGNNGLRRLHGCFEDAFLDTVQAKVVSVVKV